MSYFTWDVDPEIFRIGFFALRYYSLLFAFGFVLSYILWKKICAWEDKPIEIADANLSYMVLGTVIGARLGHVLFYEPMTYLKDPIRILNVWEGGLASHGAVIGILIAIYLLTRKYKLSFLWVADRNSIGALLACGLIRVGNFFNSEIVGRPAEVPWAVVFKRVDQLPRHPTQFYEAIGYLLISALLYWLYRKHDTKPPKGRLLGLAMVLGLTHRFLMEFFKENQVAFESGMVFNMGQLLSLPLLAVGLFLLISSKDEAKKGA